MKTRFIFLVLLITFLSCTTNNKPVSDAQKVKIIGEVKEVASTLIKGAEEANFDMVIGLAQDSPDFIAFYNGNPFTYTQFAEMGRSILGSLENQESTIIDEKYVVLDKSTVMHAANTKWVMNFKDGKVVLQDPWAMHYIYKKIDNRWKIVSINESGIEKTVKAGEAPNEINQFELHQQFVGIWTGNMGKDTIVNWEVKSYGKGFEGSFKIITMGKVSIEGKQLWGYDKLLDKCTLSEIIKGMDNALYASWFISKTKCVMVHYDDLINPDKASMKYEIDFKSPDMLVQTTIVNNKTVKIDTMVKRK